MTGLLDLPVEIRRQILRFLMRSNSSCTAKGYKTEQMTLLPPFRCESSILCINRQLNGEAKDLLFSGQADNPWKINVRHSVFGGIFQRHDLVFSRAIPPNLPQLFGARYIWFTFNRCDTLLTTMDTFGELNSALYGLRDICETLGTKSISRHIEVCWIDGSTTMDLTSRRELLSPLASLRDNCSFGLWELNKLRSTGPDIETIKAHLGGILGSVRPFSCQASTGDCVKDLQGFPFYHDYLPACRCKAKTSS